MSDDLYMNVEAASQTLMEMKEYDKEKTHLFAEYIAKPVLVMYESKPWVADSYKEYNNLLSDLYQTQHLQDLCFEDLIARLKNEIQQWEETSQIIGS